MEKRVVVAIIPNCDVTCDGPLAYTSFWMKEVIMYAQKLNYEVLFATGDKANLRDAVKVMAYAASLQRPTLFIASGHGYDEFLTGQYMQNLFDMRIDVEKLMKDNIVYFMTCSTAKKLGKVLVKAAGVKTFIGFDKLFLWRVERWGIRPQDDKLSEPYRDLTQIIPKAILDGKDVRTAISEYNIKSQYWYRYFRAKGKKAFVKGEVADCESIQTHIWHNEHSLRVYGDENARLISDYDLQVQRRLK